MTSIVRVAIGLAIGMVILFAALLLAPAPTGAPPVDDQGPTPSIEVDEELAQRGAELYTRYGCTACHSVSSLGISGGSAGPDLSRVLFGVAPGGTRSEAHPIPRWYAENGLADPRSDPDEAAKLLAKFLEHPPAYSPLMQGQIQRLSSAAGGEEQWEEEAEALAEFLKRAAAAGSR